MKLAQHNQISRAAPRSSLHGNPSKAAFKKEHKSCKQQYTRVKNKNTPDRALKKLKELLAKATQQGLKIYTPSTGIQGRVGGNHLTVVERNLLHIPEVACPPQLSPQTFTPPRFVCSQTPPPILCFSVPAEILVFSPFLSELISFSFKRSSMHTATLSFANQRES